jgi:uracil-DNA glycosylase
MAYKIVFVGSNPSQRSASIVPFWMDTRSNKILASWISRLEPGSIESIHYLNVSNKPTPNNRPLKTSEIKENLERLKKNIEVDVVPDKVIALGKTAAVALTLLRIPFYGMPHPSGLNRQLNDPKFVEEKLKELKKYLVFESYNDSSNAANKGNNSK